MGKLVAIFFVITIAVTLCHSQLTNPSEPTADNRPDFCKVLGWAMASTFHTRVQNTMKNAQHLSALMDYITGQHLEDSGTDPDIYYKLKGYLYNLATYPK